MWRRWSVFTHRQSVEAKWFLPKSCEFDSRHRLWITINSTLKEPERENETHHRRRRRRNDRYKNSTHAHIFIGPKKNKECNELFIINFKKKETKTINRHRYAFTPRSFKTECCSPLLFFISTVCLFMCEWVCVIGAFVCVCAFARSTLSQLACQLGKRALCVYFFLHFSFLCARFSVGKKEEKFHFIVVAAAFIGKHFWFRYHFH